MKKTWFISDLHLDPSRPDLFKLFDEFIDSITNKAEALYILGDLFEVWIGDDIIDQPLGVFYPTVIDKLKKLSDSGVKIYFMHGNRDFLINNVFIQSIGATLLPDPTTINLYGVPTLLMHGDSLCTDDKAYQRMRFLFRLKLIQKLYLSLTLTKRQEKLEKIKKVSANAKKNKSMDIMDVNQQAVNKAMRNAKVLQLIHGHTHRPAIHTFSLDDQALRRVVLGDWRDKPCYFCIDNTTETFVS